MRLLTVAVRLTPFFLAALQLPAQHRIVPVSPADLNQQAEFSVYLPLQNSDQLDQLLADLHDPSSANYHHWLTPEQFRSSFGASQAALDRVTGELTARGLTVVGTHSHGLRVRGKVGAIQAAFGAPLWNGRSPDGGTRLVAAKPLQLPASMAQAGAHVAAFSTVIDHHVHAVNAGLAPDNRYSPAGPYWFDDLKQAYTFPSFQRLTGAGRTIAIVMASDFLDSDMTHYFGHEHLAVPNIVRATVDGGAKFDPNSGASFEVSLDIQQSGGMAPGATILLVNIPDLSHQSVMDAYTAIIENNAADIVSSSFGLAEGVYTAAYNGGTDFTWIVQQYDDLFRHGNA